MVIIIFPNENKMISIEEFHSISSSDNSFARLNIFSTHNALETAPMTTFKDRQNVLEKSDDVIVICIFP